VKASLGSDQTDQLISADHNYQSDESYSYDANGNRTGGGYTTGNDNRLTNDGTFSYSYDHKGLRRGHPISVDCPIGPCYDSVHVI
jgi:YD repeat-containing protein